MTRLFLLLFTLGALLFSSLKTAYAHCDTMDGPVVGDAKKAIETGNVNYVLKWVQPGNEEEVREAFNLSMKVRSLNADVKKLSDKYFFETVVRLHRMGEGIPYTGIKPAGTAIDQKIIAADRSLSMGNLSPLEKLVPKSELPELNKLFKKALSLKKYDVNDVKAGREYIEAYVRFFHFAEGEEKGRDHEPLDHIVPSKNNH